MTPELEDARQRSELYRRLLGLLEHERLGPLLEEALEVIVARGEPREALIEVIGDDGLDMGPHLVAYGCRGDRAAEISAFASRGIIGEAMATGRTVVTANAAEDPRFLAFESVQRHRLETVLCVPIGRDVPVGVLYLQGKQGVQGFRAYGEAVQADIELAARALGVPIERMLRRGAATCVARCPADVDDPFSAVRGKSQAILGVVERLRLAAPLDVHVLLTGPSGVGKTLLATAVHLASRRRGSRFVELNCATLPEALLENELFGAEPGAHSNVPKGGSKGKVEAAEGGTLFLDEIAELSLGAQAKLLQLLQSKTYYRLGGTEVQRADVRVVAATNVNLKLAVAEKRFREDLYYRLQVLEVRVPTLAERGEDLLPLSIGFLEHATERHQLPRKALSPSAMRAIQSAEWPGNVRELANRIESATIHAHLRGSDWVEGRDIFPDDPGAADEAACFLRSATREFQRKHVLGVLTSTDWDLVEAARILDVSRSQIYNLIRAFELKRA
ncbi:MAG TPA: sigma 54-interacting transcriptional regulator [Kofleriaceae bacterium]|nr:sigma 54-interacting transcriptional regulator [Kofleriaceae bacterium]